MILFVQGECSQCGQLIQGNTADPDSGTANLYLTVPGQGHFAKTVWRAELICKNAQLCHERQVQAAQHA